MRGNTMMSAEAEKKAPDREEITPFPGEMTEEQWIKYAIEITEKKKAEAAARKEREAAPPPRKKLVIPDLPPPDPSWPKCALCGDQYREVNASGECWGCERAKAEAAEKEDRARRRMVQLMGGERAYELCTFDKYHVVDGNRSAFEFAKAFDPSQQSAFFWSWCGSGKSHLAKAIAREQFSKGKSVDVMKPRQLIRSLRGRDAIDEELELQRIVNLDVWVLDEVGLDSDTSYAIGSMCEILDRRTDAGRHGLIITSNLSLKDLEDKLGDDRLTSRIVGECSIIKVAPLGPDGKTPIDWRKFWARVRQQENAKK